MEWLTVPFIIIIAGWWIYVIQRRKKREAKELDKRLKEEADWNAEMTKIRHSLGPKPIPGISKFNRYKIPEIRDYPIPKRASKSEIKPYKEQTGIGYQAPDPYYIGNYSPPPAPPESYSGGGGQSAGGGASGSWDSPTSSPSSSPSGSSD